MKTATLTFLVFLGVILAAQSRWIGRGWTKEELTSSSDLIIVGTVVSVKNLSETTNLPGFDKVVFHGVETEFRVIKVTKGEPSAIKVLLHHYRSDQPIINGPTLVTFTPNRTNQYMLYLKRDGLLWFAPASGQVDPSFSVQKLK